MARSEAPASRKPPVTATPNRLPLSRQLPTLLVSLEPDPYAMSAKQSITAPSKEFMIMRHWFRPLALFALFVIGACGWWFMVHQDRHVFGGIVSGQPAIDWRVAILGYAATILGVTLGAFYRRLRGQTTINNFHCFFKQTLRSTDLWAGYCASPLVFGLVLLTTSGVTLAGLIVIGLQNGFCCHVVIERLLPH